MKAACPRRAAGRDPTDQLGNEGPFKDARTLLDGKASAERATEAGAPRLLAAAGAKSRCDWYCTLVLYLVW